MNEYTEILSKIESKFFDRYEQEVEILSDAIACDSYAKFTKLIEKHGEKTLSEFFSSQLRTNVNSQHIFDGIKSVPGFVDFI